MSDPMFAGLAVRLTEDQFTSVQPDAPAVPERARRTPVADLRLRAASNLRAVAGWVEPAPRRSCQPG